jgi:hypothetical protein
VCVCACVCVCEGGWQACGSEMDVCSMHFFHNIINKYLLPGGVCEPCSACKVDGKFAVAKWVVQDGIMITSLQLQNGLYRIV